MTPTPIEAIAAFLFALALLHTFLAQQFVRLSHRFPRHAGLFHLFGEVEVVFGFWDIVLVATMALVVDAGTALNYANSRNYTEPLFVVAVIQWLSRRAPVPAPVAAVWLGFTAVPLLGSLITEPAAMTIAALMLAPQVFRLAVPALPKYFALGVLFVNISIGGTLTSYAAPPVLMMAQAWGWDSAFMFTQFG